MNKRDCRGKTIFLGIDVHKKTYSVVALCNKVLVKQDTMTACPKKLVAYLNKYFPNANICSAYEAGFSGLALHRYLKDHGVNNIVVNAASIEIGARDRVKTDRRDALKIAKQLSAGHLESIFIPSKEMEDHKELTRTRATLVKDRNRVSIRLKSKANYHGLVDSTDTQRVCKDWIEKLMKKQMGPCSRQALQLFVEQWYFLTEQIKKIEKQLKEQAQHDDKYELVYSSIPGVGLIAGRTLAYELGDMLQFNAEKGLFSYTGLTPSEHSSGDHIRRGHISRQGKSVLRSVLIQCSWTAIRYDKGLREVYERIARRAGGKRAIVAVARRLVGKMRACFKNKCEYKYDLLEKAA